MDISQHELCTPITVIQTILDRIRKKRRTSKEYEQALYDISLEVDRLRTLTEDLLHLAHGDAEDPAFEAIKLSILIEGVSDSLYPLMEAKGLNFKQEIEDNLCMRVDSDDLMRLFVNLIDNAIKFTEHDEIRLTAGWQNNSINILVIDTGTGIDARHLPHIFDRFYRSDESRTIPRFGSGLTIVKDIVQRHQGKLR